MNSPSATAAAAGATPKDVTQAIARDLTGFVGKLENFKVKVNIRTAHDSYEAWRESDHDDLVLALALACWWAEKQPVLRVTSRPAGL